MVPTFHKLATTSIMTAGIAALAACSLEPDLPRIIRLDPVAPEIRFEGVNVFDSKTGNVAPEQTVVLRGDAIAWIGPAAGPDVPAPLPGSQRIDGRGKWLTPGLFDAHVHVLSPTTALGVARLPNLQRNLDSYLYAGVTSVLDLGGSLEEIVPLRGKLARGELQGPNLHVSGPPITVRDGHPFAMFDAVVPCWAKPFLPKDLALDASSVEAAREHVSRLAGAGVNVIKIMNDDIPLGVPRITAPALAGATAQADVHNLRSMVHVGSVSHALEAAEAGAEGLAHTPHLDRFTPAQAQTVARAQMVAVSTLRVWDNVMAAASGPVPLTAAEKHVIDPEIGGALESGPDRDEIPEIFAETLKAWTLRGRTQGTNLRALQAAGAPILAGTDSPNIATVPGISMHQELEALVAAGLSPSEALQAATLAPAEFLGLDQKIGVIRVGARADLLLLDADPTQDIVHIGKIAAVFAAGRRVHRLP